MKIEIRVSENEIIKLLRGKTIKYHNSVGNGDIKDIVIVPKSELVCITRDELQELQYDSEMRVIKLMERLNKGE